MARIKLFKTLERDLGGGLVVQVASVAPTRSGSPQATVELYNGQGVYQADVVLTNESQRGKFVEAAVGAEPSLDRAALAKALVDFGFALAKVIDTKGAGQSDEPTVGDVVKDPLAQALSEWETWHSPDGEPFVTFGVDGVRQNHRLASRAVHRRLAFLFYQSFGEAPRESAVQDALAVLAARAQFEGPEHAVHLRLAGHEGRIWLDLGTPAWDAVCIGPDAWRIVASTEVPVKFRRAGGMLALPAPAVTNRAEFARRRRRP